MTHHARLGAGLTVLTLSPIIAFATAGVAHADTATPSTKAAIEHAEAQAGSGRSASTAPTSKAQVERDERSAARAGAVTSSGTSGAPGTDPATGSSRAGSSTAGSTGSSGSSGSGDSGAAAWQLALSAALGAGLTGGVVIASRQLSQQQPVPG